MSITYAIKKTKNPNGAEGTEYFHAQAIKNGELTLEKLAKRINNSTTVTQTDCRGGGLQGQGRCHRRCRRQGHRGRR